jgi:hypothetical protein
MKSVRLQGYLNILVLQVLRVPQVRKGPREPWGQKVMMVEMVRMGKMEIVSTIVIVEWHMSNKDLL